MRLIADAGLYYRLAAEGAAATHLRQVVTMGTNGQQIAKVLAWLRLNFNRTLRIDEPVASENISPSTFRQHFRDVAGMSPLQYQKQLRLQEARQIMLNEHVDASVAGLRVGYESPSQFSSEYSRLFGAPPQQDIRGMRIS
ncbi:helix-turn-helix domain-containing protein [Xanthomonas arboricola pv. corylina]|uniref:helix-turn-helix domain-containing protein n=1 Tax=Xanthomonas arboricola TaxID=56448 RepID=UPI0003A8AA85|nr:AraC family transcriptional regulator [Xanthomonas arboricola]